MCKADSPIPSLPFDRIHTESINSCVVVIYTSWTLIWDQLWERAPFFNLFFDGVLIFTEHDSKNIRLLDLGSLSDMQILLVLSVVALCVFAHVGKQEFRNYSLSFSWVCITIYTRFTMGNRVVRVKNRRNTSRNGETDSSFWNNSRRRWFHGCASVSREEGRDQGQGSGKTIDSVPGSVSPFSVALRHCQASSEIV